MKTLFLQPDAKVGDKIAAEVVIRRYKDQFNDHVILMECDPDKVFGLPIDFMVHDELWPHMSSSDLQIECDKNNVNKVIILHSSPPTDFVNYFARYQFSPSGKCWGRLVGSASDSIGGPGLPKNTYFLHVFTALQEAKKDGYLYKLDVEAKNPLPRAKRMKIAYHQREVPWQTERNVPDKIHREILKELKKIGSVWEIKGLFKDVKELAAKIKGCDLFVGCESGPLHLAAAVGVPCIGAHFFSANHESAPLPRGPMTLLTRRGSKFNTSKQVLDCIRKMIKQ